MPVFLEDNFLIPGRKVTFGFIPYQSDVLIYIKKIVHWNWLKWHTDCPVSGEVRKNGQ